MLLNEAKYEPLLSQSEVFFQSHVPSSKCFFFRSQLFLVKRMFVYQHFFSQRTAQLTACMNIVDLVPTNLASNELLQMTELVH